MICYSYSIIMVRINTDCFLIDKVKSLSFLTWDDRTKIKNELGWEPKTKFEDGIIKTIDWYLANPDWLK